MRGGGVFFAPRFFDCPDAFIFAPPRAKEQILQYITLKELQAKLGGRGRTTIYRDCELGRLPKPMKLGSRLYWNEADIDAALAAHAE